MGLQQKIRKPEQIEPPDWIGHEFTDGKCPCLRMWYQLQPRDFRCWLRRIAADIVQFRFFHPRIVLRHSIDGKPRNQPDKADSARCNKCRSPAVSVFDPGHNE